MNVIESTALGKRYRRTWALRDCTLDIPGGHIVALVAPNGASKAPLLTLAVGLTTPTEGGVTVSAGCPRARPTHSTQSPSSPRTLRSTGTCRSPTCCGSPGA